MGKRKLRKKLTRKGQKLASRYIAEEFETGKYEPKQAVAIGLSRARAKLKEISRRHRLKYH